MNVGIDFPCMVQTYSDFLHSCYLYMSNAKCDHQYKTDKDGICTLSGDVVIYTELYIGRFVPIMFKIWTIVILKLEPVKYSRDICLLFSIMCHAIITLKLINETTILYEQVYLHKNHCHTSMTVPNS